MPRKPLKPIRLGCLVVSLAWMSLAASPVRAITAKTLPRKVFRFELFSSFTFLSPPTFAFGGLTTPSYSSTAKSSLGNMGQMVGLLSDFLYPGTPNDLGKVDFDLNVEAYVLLPSVFWGVTDWLSVGFSWPMYVYATTRINKMQVGTGFLGYNARYLEDPQNNPPVVAATDPAAITGTAGVLRIAQDFFGYDPIRNWQDEGIGDLYLTSRLRLHHGDWHQLSTQLTVAVPVGETEDPDNLLDWGFGDGQTDLMFGVLGEVTWVPRLKIFAELSYTVQLPDTERLRVYPFADFPVAPKHRKSGLFNVLGGEDEVNRDLGDNFFCGAVLEYFLTDWLMLSAAYSFMYHFEDSYSLKDNPQVALTAMEVRTDLRVQTVQGGIGIDTTIPFFKKRFAVPFYYTVFLKKSFSRAKLAAPLSVLMELGVYYK